MGFSLGYLFGASNTFSEQAHELGRLVKQDEERVPGEQPAKMERVVEEETTRGERVGVGQRSVDKRLRMPCPWFGGLIGFIMEQGYREPGYVIRAEQDPIFPAYCGFQIIPNIPEANKDTWWLTPLSYHVLLWGKKWYYEQGGKEILLESVKEEQRPAVVDHVYLPELKTKGPNS
ncbi:MAG: hypothetical protein DRO11_07450 [Methanobacteriota archaeon]|nr:MAG: hypothetical protein DRO11_07450 [Euryarchaeota archaeon]